MYSIKIVGVSPKNHRKYFKRANNDDFGWIPSLPDEILISRLCGYYSLKYSWTWSKECAESAKLFIRSIQLTRIYDVNIIIMNLSWSSGVKLYLEIHLDVVIQFMNFTHHQKVIFWVKIWYHRKLVDQNNFDMFCLIAYLHRFDEF